MAIGIIGLGVVGKAIESTLSKEFKMIKYDKYISLDSFENLISCDFVFIAVPTPFDCKLNKVDDSAVIESLDRLQSIKFENTVIIKSTLTLGSCDQYSQNYNFGIVFNPEFLRESTTPNEDFENQDTVTQVRSLPGNA